MLWLAGLLGVLVGGAVTAAIVYIIVDRRSRATIESSRTNALIAEQRCADLSSRLNATAQDNELARQKCTEAEKQSAALTAQLRAAEQNLAEQRRMLDEAQAKLRDAFASVSAEALAKNNEAFLQLAQEKFASLSTDAAGTLDLRNAQVEGMLKPMRETLTQYQQRLAEIEKSRVESYSMLREQLGTLMETERTLKTQTGQLVTALSRPTTRGQWGEVTLRRLVELAGLSNRCDFVEQITVEGEDGRMRPDMLIRLPGGREIVVDCKASLDAFLDAAAANDEDMRHTHLQRHSQQVRARARELCAKSYWTQFRSAPEFVVMFLPGESFFSAAVEADAGLYEDCLRSRVVVATPTTLLAVLRAIEYGWKQQDMTENAERIRTLGVELYERIVIVLAHARKLGSAISSTVTAYNDTLGSLESRVIVSARKMSELGAKTDKDIPDLLSIDNRPRALATSE